jgi:uncharacterized delta-60 repeat protein
MRRISSLLFPLALLLAAFPALAQDGSLDLTFGTGGLVTTDFASGVDRARALVVQPDGKLVAAGYTVHPTDGVSFALARYLEDGSPDLAFGTGGLVTTNFGPGSDVANALVLQPDGKLVAAGYTVHPTDGASFALARYDEDGALDPTFGTGGRVTTSFEGGADRNGGRAFALVLQPDGKLVAAGSASESVGGTNFALARYDEDGTLDPSFGTGGRVTTDFAGYPPASPDVAYALLLQSDGKLVAAGVAHMDSFDDTDFALARYLEDGSLDLAFGTGGLVTTNFGWTDGASALIEQPDGKLVATGSYRCSLHASCVGLARYLPGGGLDVTFGISGLVKTIVGDCIDDDDYYRRSGASALLLQPDGKLIAAGRADQPACIVENTNRGVRDFALLRYLPDGTPDATFGTGGLVLTDFGGDDDQARALVLQPDGKLVVAGYTGDDAGGDGQDFALARYENTADPGPDGTPPTCTFEPVTAGPPQSRDAILQDAGSGLASVAVLAATNADVTIPPFAVGTTAPLTVTAVQVNAAAVSVVELLVTDVAGNTETCTGEIPPLDPAPDETPPVCGPIVLEYNGPGGALSAILSSASDPESGIASIRFTRLRNLLGYAGGPAALYEGESVNYGAPHPTQVSFSGGRISYSAGGSLVVRVTNGAGLWRDCDPVLAQLSATAPEAFALEAPYPNPARAGEPVRLAFAVAEAREVRVSVYDVAGREVARLVDGPLEAGRYEVAWTGADASGGALAAGVYVVRMEAGAFTHALRVTVLP